MPVAWFDPLRTLAPKWFGMKVLVVGKGGREHALAWKLAQSPDVAQVLAAPGNPGIAEVAKCVPIDVKDTPGIIDVCEAEGVSLVVVGPETPLIGGLGNALRARGFPVFGPNADGARLEGSKVFAKNLFRKHGIPTARFEVFEDAGAAEDAARSWGGPLVVKADGEAAGKGVLMCRTPDEAAVAVRAAMLDRVFGQAGDRIVVEDWLEGAEVSVFGLCDGTTVIPLQTAQDYKRAGEGDTGPNTGGMGAVSPVPFVTPEMMDRAMDEILRPTVAALRAEGIDYRGVLYAGLMWTADGWRVLEYNCRFGDPETQAILPRLDSDLFPVVLAAAQGDLSGQMLSWSGDASACICLTSKGYPGDYETGNIIRGIRLAGEMPGVTVFHAGTTRNEQGVLATAGGRVLNVVATGPTHAEALRRAYEACDLIDFTGKTLRRDIGRNLAGAGEGAQTW